MTGGSFLTQSHLKMAFKMVTEVTPELISSFEDSLSTKHLSHLNIILERVMHSICYNFTVEVRFLITLAMIQQRSIFVGQRYSQHVHDVLLLFIHHARFSTVQ